MYFTNISYKNTDKIEFAEKIKEHFLPADLHHKEINIVYIK